MEKAACGYDELADTPGLDPGGSPVQVKVLSQRRKLQSACGDFYNVNLYYNPNLFPIGDTFGLLVFLRQV